MFPVPEGVPVWLLAAVPVAVLAVVVGSQVVRGRRDDDSGSGGGRRRAPWLWPVLVGVGAFAMLKLLTDR